MSDSKPPEGTTRLDQLALPPLRTQPRLTWNDDDGPHEQVIDERVVVGGAAGSGLLVRDRAVSRVHAELEVRDDGLWVRDLGSRNGTFVSGVQVTGARIADGATLRLGNTEIVIDHRADEPCAVPLWPAVSLGSLLGRSVAMRALFASLARVAPTNASVLIRGETGTGKELVASALHDLSPRANKPFVVVDCAALPPSLLDSELFGHAKGAFTGALSARVGAIEAADGGTVFLDEIGELPLEMQPKLLRVLESRTVRRVGEHQHRSVDVRFVSATHRDLLRMVAAGDFREDLYFRLCVVPVEVPPLRDRKEDIGLLVDHFLEKNGAAPLDPQLVPKLAAKSWRGNVRELRNFVDRVMAVGPTQALAMIDDSIAAATEMPAPPSSPSLPPVPDPPSAVSPEGNEDLFLRDYRDFREAWIDAGEKEYLKRLLERHGHNVAAAAKAAGVDRTHVYRLLRKHER